MLKACSRDGMLVRVYLSSLLLFFHAQKCFNIFLLLFCVLLHFLLESFKAFHDLDASSLTSTSRFWDKNHCWAYLVLLRCNFTSLNFLLSVWNLPCIIILLHTPSFIYEYWIYKSLIFYFDNFCVSLQNRKKTWNFSHFGF